MGSNYLVVDAPNQQGAFLPMFKYHFDVLTMVTAKPDQAFTSATSLSTSSSPPKKVYLIDRSHYYTLKMEKLIAEQEELDESGEQNKFYARLRVGIPDEKMRKQEQELIKAWSLQHRGERLIELQPDTDETATVEAREEELATPKRRSRSRSKQKPCKKCQATSKKRLAKTNNQLPKTAKPATGPPSPTDQIARNLVHDAYTNQCIVLLDFSGEANDENSSVEQLISFRLNCVSSQFPSQHRTKLSLILETFAYEPSKSGGIRADGHRRVDVVSYPLFIFWPGGAANRVHIEQQSLLKDQQLEALHDSIQVGPHNLPNYYWSTIPGKGFFASILEAPTTYGRADTEPSLTYLDRGLSYILRLKNLNFIPGSHPVKLRTNISLCLNCPTEKEQFTNWALMNESAKPMLDIDYSKCIFASDPPVVVLDVTRSSNSTSNSLSLQWAVWHRTDDEVKLALKFNCLSSQFTAEKATYHLGQPLCLTVDTYNDSFEGQSRKIDSSTCLVVVLDQGQSEQQRRLDCERFCLKRDPDVTEKEGQPRSPTSQTQPKVAALCPSTPLQPSYTSTLLRTKSEFVVKQILFISIGVQNEYHPLFLHQLELAHFREGLFIFLRKWLPASVERETLGDVFVQALPEQPTTPTSHLGQMLTNELIAKMGSKALLKCILFKDNHTKKGETDVKLIFQSDGI